MQTLPAVTKLEAYLIVAVVTLWFSAASAVILLVLPTVAQIPVLLVWCAVIWQTIGAFRDLEKVSPSGKTKGEATNTPQKQTEQSTRIVC